MVIRCIHCRYRFVIESPGLIHELTGAVCPSCGRETPPEAEQAGEGHGSDEPGTAELEKPAEAEPPATHGSPSPAEAEAPTWMVLKENGKVYGPFSAEVVVGWISERKINASEEVSPDGIEWWSFGEHEEFAHFFDDRLTGIEVPLPSGEDIHFRRKTPFRDFFKSLGRFVVFVVFLVGIVGGAWLSSQNTWLVVPEATLEDWVSQAKGLVEQEQVPVEVTGPRPGDLLLEELAKAHEGVKGGSWEPLMRGRHLMLEDTDASLRASRTLLEQAVVLDPKNGLALAALAELYNILAARRLGDRDLQRKSIYLLERAQSGRSWQAESLRARATFLLYSEHPEEVESVVKEAITLNPRDPQLHFLLAMAEKGSSGDLTDKARGHFEDALKLDPGFHGVWHELGRAEELQGRLWTANEHYQNKIALAPGSPSTLIRLGVVHEALGEPEKAAGFYDQAIALDPDAKQAVVRRAILKYQHDGEPAVAAEMLAALEQRENVVLDIREKKELWTHRSAALRLAGDIKGAVASADQALGEDANYSPALFHKALALVAKGKASKALPLLSRADSAGLSKWQRAVVLFQEARAARAAGQMQDALDAYGRAIDANPAYMPAYLWRVDVRLKLGDASLASAELIKHLGVDPLEYSRSRIAGLYYEPLPDLQPLTQRMLSVAQEQNFAPQLHTSAGVLLFHDGRFEQAEYSFETALMQSERSETANFYKAMIPYQQGEYRAALHQFDGLLELSRSKGIFHVYRADTLFLLGQRKASAKSFKESFGLGIRSPWVHGRLAEVLFSTGETDAVEKEIKRALELDKASCALASSRFRIGL